VTIRLAAKYVPKVPAAVLDARIAFLMVMTEGAYSAAASSV